MQLHLIDRKSTTQDSMDAFNSLTEHVLTLLTSVGIEKHTIKALFDSYGLDPLWSLLRDTYLNPYYILFAIPLWLVLQRLWPSEPPTSRAKSSLLLDFLYPLLSLPIRVLLILSVAAALNRAFEMYVPFLNLGILNDQPVVIQALGAFLIVDFMFYVSHFLKHKIPWLWYFHTIHHSQRYLNPLTTHRNHPVEELIDLAIKTVPIAVVGGSYPTWGWFIFFNNMWGYYIHSSVRTNLGPLKYLIVTPQNHRLHHTIEPDQIDRNFGERLTVWDWLFGTLYTDFDEYPRTGVPGCEPIEERGIGPLSLCKYWVLQFVYPFVRIAQDLSRFGTQLVQRWRSVSTG